jgi:flagellar hook-length control protein FliK
MSTQAMTKFSGEGTGSNLQSNTGNASYTQLMTQATAQPVTQNIHKPEWGNAIGQRISWMIGSKLQGAQLRITPAHLGPVDIRISIESGVAQVSFVSNHQVVRDALEQAIPRLREMMEGQNLELGDVDISDRSLADSNRAQDEFSHLHGKGESANEGGLEAAVNEDAKVVVQVVETDSLLDAYA